jgi:hypothetical protein
MPGMQQWYKKMLYGEDHVNTIAFAFDCPQFTTLFYI